MTAPEINDYLADSETIHRQWGGKLENEGLFSTSHTFVATDRRLAVLKNDGSFTDIDYDHITSIQTSSLESVDWRPLLKASSVFVFLSGLWFLFINNTLAGLAMIAVGGVGYWIETNTEEESGESATDTKHKITVVTTDERESEITFTTDENVGATLSKLIRDD